LNKIEALEMTKRLMINADAFANRAKQHDDMTLVVARIV